MRPYLSYRIDRLEYIAKRGWQDAHVLLGLYKELQFRRRRRSRFLLAKVASRLLELREQSFRWPTTNAPAGDRAFPDSVFKVRHGILSALGYHVGASGLGEAQRRALLDRAYSASLPSFRDSSYASEWGTLRSGARLRKMANTIAALTRNAKRRRTQKMRVAVEQWESDLRYLKRRYYDGMYEFRWPRTR